MVSWENPDANDRDLGMDDYLRLGAFAALDAIGSIRADAPVHLAGCCLRGTLDAKQMAGAFQMLRSNDLTDIRAPIFAIGTLADHVAPWRSVYKIHLLSDSEVTFALTSGGHNAGIVAEPGHANRSFQLLTRQAHDTPSTRTPGWGAHRARKARGGRRGGSGWPRIPANASFRGASACRVGRRWRMRQVATCCCVDGIERELPRDCTSMAPNPSTLRPDAAAR
jgi:hypothetical protein